MTVVLLLGGTRLQQQQTNAFGDFKFDGLNDGAYTISVEHEQHGRLLRPVVIEGRSRYLAGLLLGEV